MRHFIFFIFLGIVSFGFLTVLKPFFYPLFWASILASIFYPLYKKINKKLKVPNLSASITLVACFLTIVLPLVVISTLVVKEASDIYDIATNHTEDISRSIDSFLDKATHEPILMKLNIDKNLVLSRLPQTAQDITGFLLSSAKDFTQNSLVFVIMFAISFYAMFFFVRDGEKLLKEVMHLCPLGDKYEKKLYEKFTSTVNATIKGTMITGFIQGLLGYFMFAVAGVKGAAIWGVLMVIMASIPAIGCYFIWLPVAIGELIMGNINTGIAMILFGTFVIGTIDNLIRPILVGKNTQIHPLIVLFSTLGGIATFGISGFIIGPVIASLFLAFWDMYDEYYKKDLDNNQTFV